MKRQYKEALYITYDIIKEALLKNSIKDKEEVMNRLTREFGEILDTFDEGGTASYVYVPGYLIPTQNDNKKEYNTRLICMYVLGVKKMLLDLDTINRLLGTKYKTLAKAKERVFGDFESLGFNVKERKLGRRVLGYMITPDNTKIRELDNQSYLENNQE